MVPKKQGGLNMIIFIVVYANTDENALYIKERCSMYTDENGVINFINDRDTVIKINTIWKIDLTCGTMIKMKPVLNDENYRLILTPVLT